MKKIILFLLLLLSKFNSIAQCTSDPMSGGATFVSIQLGAITTQECTKFTERLAF